MIFLDLDEERGKLIAAQFNSFALKVNLVENLAEPQIKDPRYKKEFADIITKMKKTNDLRNNIIHGRWSYSFMLSDLVNIHAVEKRSVTRNGKPKKSPISKSIVMDAANAALDTAIKLELILRVVPREKPKDRPPT